MDRHRSSDMARIVVVGVLAWLGTTARAQFEVADVPNLSGVLSHANGGGKRATLATLLSVPTVDPGAGARAVAEQLQSYEQARRRKSTALDGLSAKMPMYLADLEAQLEKNGFPKRDFGVAVAFAVVFNYETATNSKLPDGASRVAARTITAAVDARWKQSFDALSPASKERLYESLLCKASLLSLLAKSSATQSPEKAGVWRENAQILFTRLTGKSPQAISFTEDGQIVGLGETDTGIVVTRRPNHSNSRRVVAKQLPNRRSGTSGSTERGTDNLNIAGVVLHSESGAGVGGSVGILFNPYLLFADGLITRAPTGAFRDWDKAADLRAHPGAWGTWRRSGKALEIVWNDGKRARWVPGTLFDAKKGTPGMGLRGRYTTVSGGGTVAYGGNVTVFAQKDYFFAPDGTFTTSSTGGGSGSNFSAYSTHRGQGRYRIDGWTITITLPDGNTRRGLFYRFPDSDNSLGILGKTYNKE